MSFVVNAQIKAAKRIGCTIEEYLDRREAGQKYCYGCNQWRRETDIITGGKHAHRCQVCRARDDAHVSDGRRRCRTCGRTKPDGCFRANRACAGGRESVCKDCRVRPLQSQRQPETAPEQDDAAERYRELVAVALDPVEDEPEPDPGRRLPWRIGRVLATELVHMRTTLVHLQSAYPAHKDDLVRVLEDSAARLRAARIDLGPLMDGDR